MIHGLCSIILLSLLVFNFERSQCFCPTESNKTKGDEKISARVFITISSLPRKNKTTGEVRERNIELNWYNLDAKLIESKNVWVGLYTEEPNENSIPKAKTHVSERKEGSFTTDISYPYMELNVTVGNNYCTGYWVALVREKKILIKNCHSARPNWMYEMKDTIGHKLLVDLMIPGTHNTGSYSKYDDRNFISFTCQDENIWNQLMYGIRFLDLRVIRVHANESSQEFRLSHDIVAMNTTVRDTLRTVKRFLQLTREIVIIDFHEFIRFDDPNTYRKLMKIIEDEVSEYAIPRSYGYNTMLNELWKNDKRLLVSFNSVYRNESLLLFPPVNQLWGEKVKNLEDLESFLEKNACPLEREKLWSAMAQISPDGLGGFVYNGLRRMAQEVNLEITRLYRTRFWKCANIVATDYFLGNDIINVAIQVNKRLFDK